jgi:hypothetical protein
MLRLAAVRITGNVNPLAMSLELPVIAKPQAEATLRHCEELSLRAKRSKL